MELEEETYDSFPACYKSSNFDAYLQPRSVKNGARPNFRARLYSELVDMHVPFIVTWVISERKTLVEKQPAHTRERADNGVIAKKAADRGSCARTAVCQFFRFVAMTNGQNHKTFIPSEDHLLSLITVRAFLEFYGQHCGAPNSAGNKAKFLVSLYKHMKVSSRGYLDQSHPNR